MSQALRTNRPEWYDHAACRGVGHLFFTRDDEFFDERPAKSICATCPVMIECFHMRLKTQERGVWGHVAEGEIHKFRGVPIEAMTPEELRAYIIRVCRAEPPRKPGRPKKEKVDA